MKKLILLLTIMSFNVMANSDVYQFWPKIPFNISGANLCQYQRAYSESRNSYMDQMANLASMLAYSGDWNPVVTLSSFNDLYNENLSYAKIGLGKTLEQSFKAYLDSYYRNIKPKVRKLQFKYLNRIAAIMNQGGSVGVNQLDKLSLIAYGSYSLSPRCNGGVFVTLTIIDTEGLSKDYYGSGPAQTVMSQIASKVFEDYQQTRFPTKINIGREQLELIGGLNSSVDSVNRPEDAEFACMSLGARLPTEKEYKLLNSYGSWSGGVSLGKEDWVLSSNQILNINSYYHVRGYQNGVNGKYLYICVR